jgi:hypothetical protein
MKSTPNLVLVPLEAPEDWRQPPSTEIEQASLSIH